MKILLTCSQCGKEMYSTGFDGVCARCLCETVRPLEVGGTMVSCKLLCRGGFVGQHDRFRLIEPIGRGGMGEVWLADDREFSEDGKPELVALKFLPPEIQDNPMALQMLKSEIRRMHGLVHENIVRIHDLHATSEGVPFIKMEYVEGNSLSDWIQGPGCGEPLDWKAVCHIGVQVATALQYAHERANLVHRDIKPSNLLVSAKFQIKVSDFGIAQLAQGNINESADSPMGTFAYASPQQIDGYPPDPADDIYSLGATLYELVTGTIPFCADSTGHLIYRIQNEIPPNLNDILVQMQRKQVPSDLASLVAACLAKAPQNRPSTKKVISFLSQLLSELPAFNEPALPRWQRFRSLVLAMVLIGSIAALTAWLLADKPQPSTLEEPGVTNSPRPSVPPLPRRTEQDIGTGEISLRLLGGERNWNVRVLDMAGLLVTNLDFRADKEIATVLSLPPGQYNVSTSQADSPEYIDEISRKVGVTAGKSTSLVISLGSVNVHLNYAPEDAVVTWEPRVPSTYAREDRSGGTRVFLREVPYIFKFDRIGYEPLELHHTFVFGSDRLPPVRMALLQQPRFDRHHSGVDRRWTNALGMEFLQSGGLYVALNETTVDAFEQFAIEEGYDATGGMFSMTKDGRRKTGASWKDPGFLQTGEHPVIGVSRDDAIAFCNWLTGKERSRSSLAPNQRYRLPSVEEWFRFSGAGTYPWGEGETVVGNFCGREVLTLSGEQAWPASWPHLSRIDFTDPFPRTAPVRSFTDMDGVYDLSGNAAEWTLDGFLVGGSWFDGEGELQSLTVEALKGYPIHPGDRDVRCGFRVVLAED